MKSLKPITVFFLLLLVSLTAAADHSRRYQALRPLPAFRSSQNRSSASSSPYVGEKHQLVFLVAFSDLTFQDPNPNELWNKIFNQPNYQEAPFVGSVRDYFYAQSYEQFDLHFDLHYVVVDNPHADYASGYIGRDPDDSRTGLLLTHVLDKVKGEITDWSVYDWDGNGYIDQVLILFAGKAQNDGGDENTIWAHQWTLSGQSVYPYKREWGKAYPVTSGGKDFLVDNYGAFGELSQDGDYGSFGTLCHEYSHCLGLPDFYYGSNTKVVGSWDVMDMGNYNAGGFSPPNYSAHERMVLGWLDIQELTATTTVTNMQSLDSKAAYLIRNDGYSDEYYIVENRQQTGWDSALPGSGLLVFHVDYDRDIWAKGVPNSDVMKRYSIISANNRSTYSANNQKGWAYPYAANDSLTNNSKPAATLNNANSDGTTLMNKSLRDIKVENGLASFRFTVDSASGIEELGLRDNQSYKILHDLGPIYIIRCSNGEIKKVMKH